MKQSVLGVAITVFALIVSCRSEGGNTPTPEADLSEMRTTAAMKDVLLQITDSASVHILELHAQLSPKDGTILNLDDPSSYRVRLRNAELTATPDNVARLLNDHALSQKDAPVRKLEISIKDRELEVKGSLNKLIDIPFEIRGQPEVTQAGDIALTATSIHAAGVPVKNLLDAFGADVADLVNEEKIPGIRIIENTVVVSLNALPLTFVESGFAAIALKDDHLTSSLRGTAPPSHVAARTDDSYVVVTGGLSRFLKLTMDPTDIEFVGKQEKGALFFNLRNYRPQLRAGMVRVTGDDGLLIHLNEQEPAIPPREN